MPPEPAISVVICAFNARRTIGWTIESVIAQTFGDWEMVIVDDGSRDGTGAVVESYLRQGHAIRYYYQKNRGFAPSRNRALELARAPWVALIDHDDVCLPRRLELEWREIQRDPGAGLVFGNSYHFLDSGKIIRRQFDAFNPVGLDLRAGRAAEHLLRYGCFIDSETVIFNRDKARKIGGFDERYRYLSDYDLFVRLGLRSNFLVIDEVLAQWRIHPGQMSSVALETVLTEHQTMYALWRNNPDASKPLRRMAAAWSSIYAFKAARFFLSKRRWPQAGRFGAVALRESPYLMMESPGLVWQWLNRKVLLA